MRFAKGYTPKKEDSKNINHFLIISLLSVEGKIFFSILAKRLADFFLRTGYIDTSLQKGGIFGVPGCLEHTGVVIELIKEAKRNRTSSGIVVRPGHHLWLDAPQAGAGNTGKAPRSSLSKRPHPELLQ